MPDARIRLLLSDVDGTLVPSDKMPTASTIDAVGRLRDAGIIFAITSARPPRGLSMFIEPLELDTPLGALNGGLVVDVDLRVIRQRPIDAHVTRAVIERLLSRDLSVWVYRGPDWFVLDRNGPYVEHEAIVTDLEPTQVTDFTGLSDAVIKIVGVSPDPFAVAATGEVVANEYAGAVVATRSQTYYLDVTHPLATKGSVVEFLSERYDVPTSEIATIGDMQNDVSMFRVSRLSVAMGNATDDVRSAATHVTRSNNDEGFAFAVNEFILA